MPSPARVREPRRPRPISSREFITHYHMERNHQGLENRLIVPLDMIDTGTAVVKKRERLGWTAQTLLSRSSIAERERWSVQLRAKPLLCQSKDPIFVYAA